MAREKHVKSGMKYLIIARVEVNGRVEEHDIIGAIFGQTEGLLGEEFSLERLQSRDKIGRVYVDIKRQGTKTVGKIMVPSNLDRVETAILAAMLETVDRIGPYDARIVIEEIKDLREEKIKRIIERSKEIIRQIKAKEPDIREIIRQVVGTEVPKPKKPRVIEYGPDRLPASPGVDKADTIILVEGRADVINLMRYGYDNVIAIGGAREKIPQTIIDLAKRKKVIALVDGDRGGELILKTLLTQAKVDYVARAPPGMEVEQLTGREIQEALSSAVPAEVMKQRLGLAREKPPAEEKPAPVPAQAEAPAPEARPESVAPPGAEAAAAQAQEAAAPAAPAAAPAVSAPEAPAQAAQPVAAPPKPVEEAAPAKPPVAGEGVVTVIPSKIRDTIRELRGTLEAIFYDENWNEIKRIKVKDLWEELKKAEPDTIYAVVFDGIITPRIMEVAKEKGVRILVGSRVGTKIGMRPEGVYYLTFSDVL